MTADIVFQALQNRVRSVNIKNLLSVILVRDLLIKVRTASLRLVCGFVGIVVEVLNLNVFMIHRVGLDEGILARNTELLSRLLQNLGYRITDLIPSFEIC